jgi:hypothetical protein
MMEKFLSACKREYSDNEADSDKDNEDSSVV